VAESLCEAIGTVVNRHRFSLFFRPQAGAE
jgi:hypothetical protein